MPLVTGLRRELSADRSHRHIVGVYTSEGTYRTNRQVVDSLQEGETWFSTNGGERVPINWIRWCPEMNCGMKPYLISRGALQKHVAGGIHVRLVPKSTDSLENLSDGPRSLEQLEGEREAVGANQEAAGQPA